MINYVDPRVPQRNDSKNVIKIILVQNKERM